MPLIPAAFTRRTAVPADVDLLPYFIPDIERKLVSLRTAHSGICQKVLPRLRVQRVQMPLRPLFAEVMGLPHDHDNFPLNAQQFLNPLHVPHQLLLQGDGGCGNYHGLVQVLAVQQKRDEVGVRLWLFTGMCG